MAIVAERKNIAVHVYERNPGKAGQFKQIATFGDVEGSEGSAHVVYGGRVHYDALNIDEKIEG